MMYGARMPLRHAVAAALALLLAACSAKEPAPRGRVIVIGVDGASHDLLEPMMREGRLPTFARLAREGAYGLMATEDKPLSPRIWTSIATGKLPVHHGIRHFVQRGADGALRLLESKDRAGAALWNIASAAGLEVAIVNWLMTHPPERVRGAIVSDYALPGVRAARIELGRASARGSFREELADPEGPRAPAIHPPEMAGDLLPLLSSVEPLTLPDPFEGNAGLLGVVFYEQASEYYWNDQRAARIALALEQRLRPDLTCVLLTGVDRVSHSLWGTLSPETAPGLSEPQRRAGEAALRRYYEIADSLVAKLVEPFGPRDLVLVMSDHGFEPLPGGKGGVVPWGGRHATPAASLGVLFARGPGVEPGSRIENARMQDVTPTLLAWLGLEVARDMDGRPLAFAQEPVRWRETWDDLAIERAGAGDPDAEAEVLRQLEALGYLESE
jgi:hypothetical protein